MGDKSGEVGRNQITKSSAGNGLQVEKTGSQETVLETSCSNPGESLCQHQLRGRRRGWIQEVSKKRVSLTK